MANSGFSQDAVLSAYSMAAEAANSNINEFARESSFLNFAVSSLGPGMTMDVQCDTGLPVSTPEEKREQLFRKKVLQSQRKANAIAEKNSRAQQKAMKKSELLARRERKRK
jgi:hypothetical protein